MEKRDFLLTAFRLSSLVKWKFICKTSFWICSTVNFQQLHGEFYKNRWWWWVVPVRIVKNSFKLWHLTFVIVWVWRDGGRLKRYINEKQFLFVFILSKDHNVRRRFRAINFHLPTLDIESFVQLIDCTIGKINDKIS